MGSKRQTAATVGDRGPVETPSGDTENLLGQDDSTPCFVYVLAFFSALGGFLFGYDTGVVSGAMLLLKKEMNLNALWQELLVSSTVGAAALSALCGGSLNGWLGRRICILVASFIFGVGGVILSIAQDKVVLLAGRIVVGLGIGIASMTVPVYIAEVSPPHLRGQLVTINALFITGGQFVASVVDGVFSYLSHSGWRYMLGLSTVPAVLQFFGFVFLPESPRWLLQKGRSQEACQVLSRIRGDQNIDEEYDTIKASIEEEEREAGAGGVVILRILSHGPTRRALVVGCGLQMFQQLSGINTVMYYSATILQMAGVRDDKQAIWLAAATSATNFVFTLVGVWLVDRVGRRKLTLGSLLGTGLSLTLLAVGFLLSAQNSPPVTFHPVDPHNSTCRLYRYGPHAVDSELRDLPTLGAQHWQRLLCWCQLDFQRPRVSDFSSRRRVFDLLRCVLHVHRPGGAGSPLRLRLPPRDQRLTAGGHREPVYRSSLLLRRPLRQ
ncbi:proton myo-inositol cotransporter isoform X4 [Austrofundulus limnaeus]|uniref:Proton myo-inositol cotransporter-like isoform X4 n=1 Tax=Austrofundulus limnaeus TaxID=52670 RepID=A0A2I4CPN5_AUSLI|nr:PREDICTED: proton myo-inositol cotransporter-like isoform X4 [Austrofundulus limnaeus]XP_013881955.1 PREDICTED: proton myo-inositol cotransporter-like isoform X4 [Austrofundulus limnaeus]